jgi:hypothetical protein
MWRAAAESAKMAGMRRPRNVLALMVVGLACALLFAFAGCTTILGDFEIEPGTGGITIGQVCTTAAQCASGFCVDGVCCDTACTGLCESCALPDKKGTCSPHAAGTDPDKECKPEPRPDAGTTQQQAATDDGGVVDGGSAVGEAGVILNIPDGGLTSDDNACAGSCDGNRKCAFPGKEKVCGTQFCNSASQEAVLACNQKGNCELDVVACGAFTCQGSACKKQCAAPADCAPTHFCNSGQCQERLANGLRCSVGTECKSGFCVDGVCCNSECNENGQIPGGTCRKSGREGTCVCTPSGSSTECTNGCRLFYKDSDRDGHGDKNVPSTGTNIAVGCVGSPPPAFFAAVKDDCNDAEPRAFPGQTAFFPDQAAGTSGWDFNCDGNAFEKETNEYPGGTCGFCRPPIVITTYPICGNPQDTCLVAGERADLDCRLSKDFLGREYYCDGPRGDAYSAGFTERVACGQPGPYISCSTCSIKGGGPNRPYSDPARVQRCR